MAHAFGIKASGAAFDGHFPNKAGPHQVTKIVISSSPRRARIDTIHGFKNFRSRGMPGVIH
jgi:hypothetical protein